MIIKPSDLNSFLSTVARHALEENISGIQDLCFIFPNRRAVQVFKSHLVKQVHKSIWTPYMTSIDDWLKELSGLDEADNISQLVNLYLSINKKAGQNETFDHFVRWGDMLLRDYDEVDKYLVPPEKVFSSIKSIKEIETQFPSISQEQLALLQKFWKGFHPSPSPYQKSWLSLWESLSVIYSDFHDRLKVKNLATNGHIYKSSLEKIKNDPEECLQHKKYLFIGFNALTAVEERIFKICQNLGKAEFYWDIPSNLEESYQESGRFIRENIKKFPPPSSFLKSEYSLPDRFGKRFPPNFKAIDIYSCESASGQVGILRQVLKQNKNGPGNAEFDSQKAVILADESLLEPVLSSILDLDTEINISMGYPLERSLLVDFLKRLIEINAYLNTRKTGNLFIQAKELAKLVNHPLIPEIMGEEFSESLLFVNDWPTGMMPLDLVISKQTGFRDLLCNNDSRKIPELLLSVLNKFNKAADKYPALETESFKKIKKWILAFGAELAANDLEVGFETFKSLFENFIQKERLPFEGSLDAGIQLTGILETRLMDYDELLILSCNEGVWPSDASPSSLIPFSLRKAYKLPTREFSDSFYGYYFYRLLQRARKVSLMYVSSPDPARMSQGDPSRFIQQLRFDSTQLCNEFLAASFINQGAPHKRTIQKTGVILKELNRYLDPLENRMLSPSAINTYIDCPLRFSFQYILRIREGDDLAEAGEPRMFGLLMHKSLELFYEQFIESNKLVSYEFLNDILKNRQSIEAYIRKAFMSEYFKIDHQNKWPDLYGKDLLVHDVISKQFASVLMYDAKYSPFRIIGLEKRVERTFEFSLLGEKKNIILGGVIDRIDEKEGVVRILDYKSGNPLVRFKLVSELFDSGRSKRPKEILQASIYSILISQERQDDIAVKPVIYPTGKMRSKLFDPGIKFNGEVLEDIKIIEEEVMQELRGVLSDIFNSDIEFKQTDNEGNCEYCVFKDYCNR